ncbi:hypothetical protein C0991_008549 [Blastosporella zonata]|nr:hypothetical protein C0991_008549 [Blastosporella zonata]
MSKLGWPFANVDAYPGADIDTLNAGEYVKDIYFKVDPDYQGRFSVPILWDKKTQTIVNNESSEIIRMFNTAFNDLIPADKAALDFYPEHLRAEIDRVNEWVYTDINNGVYCAGVATTQSAYEVAVTEVFKALDQAEKLLEGKDYLVGNQLTEADVRLFVTANDPLTQSFTSADWIWTSENGSTPPLAPAGTRAFRKTYTPPSGLSATAADILITVDNGYSLYVSGQLVGSSSSTQMDGWEISERYHVSLSPGSIVFAIEGINENDVNTGAETYAGVLAAIRIIHSDGSTATLTSDTSWRATANIPTNFQQPALDDSSWGSAVSFGQYGVDPWDTKVSIPPAPATTTQAPSTPTSISTSHSTVTITSTQTISEQTLQTTSSSAQPSSSSSSAPLSPLPSGSAGTTVNPGVATTSTGSTALVTNDPSITSSPSSGASGVPQNSSSKTTPIGPIVGGVVGGVVIAALLAFIVLCRKRLFPSRRNSRFSSDFPSPGGEVTEQLIEPFPLGNLGHSASSRPTELGASPRSLEPVGKFQRIHTEPEYRQDSDITSEGSSSPVIIKSAPGMVSTRLQRLQALMSELNREIATHGEASPYVSELRGRIAELNLEHPDADVGPGLGHIAIPPPYQ